MKISQSARNAIVIGGLCSLSYFAVYIARNILGASSPQMIEQGVYTTEQVGLLSSIYFTTYALGQLINGFIGDKIKARYMISFGLILAAISYIVFTGFTGDSVTAYVAYGSTGYFLAMIYGPMTKVVAENTDPIHATRCSLGYTFASLLGTPLAGVLAAVLVWRLTFLVSSVVLLAMGTLCFTIFLILEKRGIISYNKFTKPKKQGNGIKVLVKRDIVRFSFIAVITGVIRTSVVFWLPTYISQYLGFSSETAAFSFTIVTAVISATPFITIFVYELLGRNMTLTIRWAFILSSLAFLGVFLCPVPILNLVFIVLAIMCCNGADTMMWSRYCPSLLDTGMVSTATGFLDFLSYMAAGVASTLFANAVTSIGWGKLILVWLGLMVVGVLVMLPMKTQKNISK